MSGTVVGIGDKAVNKMDQKKKSLFYGACFGAYHKRI